MQDEMSNLDAQAADLDLKMREKEDDIKGLQVRVSRLEGWECIRSAGIRACYTVRGRVGRHPGPAGSVCGAGGRHAHGLSYCGSKAVLGSQACLRDAALAWLPPLPLLPLRLLRLLLLAWG